MLSYFVSRLTLLTFLVCVFFWEVGGRKWDITLLFITPLPRSVCDKTTFMFNVKTLYSSVIMFSAITASVLHI
jgi:hypothetical protein